MVESRLEVIEILEVEEATCREFVPQATVLGKKLQEWKFLLTNNNNRKKRILLY